MQVKLHKEKYEGYHDRKMLICNEHKIYAWLNKDEASKEADPTVCVKSSMPTGMSRLSRGFDYAEITSKDTSAKGRDVVDVMMRTMIARISSSPISMLHVASVFPCLVS
jgi:hypothetical protein